MKFNSKQVLKNLDGKEIQDGKDGGLTVGKVLAIILTSTSDKSPDPLKSYALGIRLYNATETVELEDNDVNFLKDAVSRNESYISLVRGQVIQILNGLSK